MLLLFPISLHINCILHNNGILQQSAIRLLRILHVTDFMMSYDYQKGQKGVQVSLVLFFNPNKH